MASRVAHIDRARRITQTLFRHGLFALIDQLGLGDRRLSPGHAAGELTAARGGRRLALALADLGPTFVKLGQFLAAREDLVPAPMARELATLHDRAPTLSRGAIRRQVANALGRPADQAFSWFDNRPLAAGSIAQVHRARTRDGRDVVVKVRRPGIQRTIDADLGLLRWLAQRAAARSEEIARIDPVALIDELGRNLQMELDFSHEAKCLGRMRQEVGDTACVPAVVDELCGDAVLTMEWIDGTSVSALPRAADPRDMATTVVACFATQYLRGGLFHADPHPGNLVRRRDGKLALLDLGATGTIDAGMRRTLLRLAAAASERDGEKLAEVVLAMVHAPAGLDHVAYCRDLGVLLEATVTRPLGEVPMAQLSGEMFAVARRHGLRFRAEYFLLLRSVSLVDGVLRSLDPSLDPVAATRAHIVRHALSRRWFGAALWLLAQTVRLRVGRWLRAIRRLGGRRRSRLPAAPRALLPAPRRHTSNAE